MAVNENAEAPNSGMPQLDFSTFPNQLFWLVVTMLCLFLMVRLLIIPRMDNILANRRKVIEEDLVGAEKFRESAEQLRASISEEIEAARQRSSGIIGKSKEKVKQNRQKGLAEAEEITAKLLADADKSIKKMEKDANKQVEKISTDLSPEIVSKMFPQT